MKKYVDLLLESIVKHDVSLLPLAKAYCATENGIPAAVCHMTCWRTISKINRIVHLVQDVQRKQVVVVANVQDGDTEALFEARLKIEGHSLKELEIYVVRSRAESGFWFRPEDMGNLPKGWTTPITEANRAGREELERLAYDLFRPKTSKKYAGSEDNYGMEQSSMVFEHVEYMSGIVAEGSPGAIPMGNDPKTNRFAVPMLEMFPFRPEDEDARVVAVDEEQGIVVVIAKVDGIVSPYVVPDETSTCFVPNEMIEHHRATLTEDKTKDKTLLVEMPATGITTQIVRFHSGKIQGMDQVISLSPYGSGVVWVK